MTVQFNQVELDDPKLVEIMANFDPPKPGVQVDEYVTDPLEGLEDARKVSAYDLDLHFKVGSGDANDTYDVTFTEICTLSVSPSKDKGVQTTADVSSPVRQRVSIEIFFAVYATGANAQQRQAIETAFRSLTAAGADIENFDLDASIEQLERLGIDEELYHLASFARFSRLGVPVRATPTTCETIESTYPPQLGDDRVQYPNANTRAPSHAKAWCSSCKFSPAPPTPTSGNNIKEYDDIGSGLDVPAAIEEDIRALARALPERIDCGVDFTVVKHRLFTLFQYPEFRLKPKPKVLVLRIFRKKIRIKITYLQLQIRWTKIALMGFSRLNVLNADQAVVNQTVLCMLEAFVVSAIAAFALPNPAAAGPVFQQWFVACMKRWLEKLVECIAVGLFFAKEKGQWDAV